MCVCVCVCVCAIITANLLHVSTFLTIAESYSKRKSKNIILAKNDMDVQL